MMAARLRRIASYVLMAVGLLAIMATSPPESSAQSDLYEGRVRLSPSTPEVRIPFEVDASDVAVDNGGFVLEVRYPTTWQGVAPSVVGRGPDISVVWGGGVIRPSVLDAPDFLLECFLECLGGGEVVLRWPAEAGTGEAAVSWSMQARVDFDSSEPPDGSQVDLAVSSPEDHGTLALAQRLALRAADPRIRTVFSVASAGALSDGDVLIERIGEALGRGPEVVVEVDGVLVPEWHWMPLAVPDACSTGPCEFEVEALVSAGVGLTRAYKAFEVRIVTLGPAVTVTAAPEEAAPNGIATATVDLTLDRDETTKFALSIGFVDRGEALSEPAVAIAPVIQSVAGLGEPESIALRLAGTDDVLHRFGENFDHTPAAVATPVSCDEGQCRFTADFELVVDGEPVGDRVVAELLIEVRVYGDAAIGDGVDLEVIHGS